MSDHSQLVKPLAWGERYEAEDGTICQFADASFGVKYLASEKGWFIQGVTQFNYACSLSDAKTAAQADYTARIISALNLDAIEALPADRAALRQKEGKA